MTERILLVDDDPDILAAFKRRLRKRFHLETAEGGEHGLEAVEDQDPFAVIVSDMRMPGMNGIQFLSEVRERAPDSVRMMLTGETDLQVAAEAVNEGNIFRFLTKPCPTRTFTKALEAGIEQYRLVVAERELLEKTLSGSVKLLTETLSLVNPPAFSLASRIRHHVRYLAVELQLPDTWQFEVAAMLSQIGCVCVPPDILSEVCSGRLLSSDAQRIFSTHPSVGAKLLSNIPRLESIARMVERQQLPFKDHKPLEDLAEEDATIALGAQMLKVAIDLDRMTVFGLSYEAILSRFRGRPDVYNPDIVATFETFPGNGAPKRGKEVRIRDLSDDVVAIAEEDILAKDGLVLVSKGQELTYPVVVGLRSFSLRVGVKEPFRVRIVDQDEA